MEEIMSVTNYIYTYFTSLCIILDNVYSNYPVRMCVTSSSSNEYLSVV